MDSYDDDTQFWAEPARRTGPLRRIGRDATGQMRRTVHVSGSYERTREHRVVTPRTTRPERQLRDTDATPIALNAFDYDLDDDYATLGHADHRDDTKWASLEGDVDAWVEPEEQPARRGAWIGIDPKLMRLGALTAAAVVLIPVAMAAAGGNDDEGDVSSASVPASVVEQPAVVQSIPTTTIPITASATNPATTQGDNPADDDQQVAASASASGAVEKATPRASTATTEAAPVCAGSYTVVAGDYWLRFEGTGASIDEWLVANDASLETNLYPGAELCIPAGAQAPAAPTTTAPPTTAPPTTAAPTTAPPTAPPTTAPPTTRPPATTAPPTTQPPATAPPATSPPTTRPPGSSGSVEQIIRSVWPDHLEEKALQIAWRESNWQPGVRNYCCYGLFQIYYEVHQSWLTSVGVDSAADLYDPYLNSLAAYTLYQRAGGWGPWSTA